MFFGFFLVFSISTLIYCLIHYKLTLFEEKDPNIYLAGIHNIYFRDTEEKIEYFNGVPNLGNTGEISFDCYIGECEECTDIYCDYYKFYPRKECSKQCSSHYVFATC